MKTLCHLLLLLVSASVCRVNAQITVDLTSEGWAPLMPDTPGQVRQIHVSGGGNVSGVDFRIQVEGGYPNGAGKDGPNIPNVDSGVDIKTGTIFSAGEFAVFDPGSNGEQFAVRSGNLSSGSVAASGLLATVTFDTTGLTASDTYTIKIAGTIGGDTRFFNSSGDPLAATLINGTLSMVPEPSTYGIVVGSLLLLVSGLRRIPGSR